MGTAPLAASPQPPVDGDLADSDARPKGNGTNADEAKPNDDGKKQLKQITSKQEPADSLGTEDSPETVKMDYYLYSGNILRGEDLRFIEYIAEEQKSDGVVLILCTPGGDPDAAYKIGRYLQSKYTSFKLFVPGYCKSAGTLLAIAADEIVFSPYGELGPLDVQMTRTDNIANLESGLNISEAFLTLENRARNTFHDLIAEITGMSGGIVSFQTASRSASEIVGALYGPIFAHIEPEDVGSRARAMRIGEDYGTRLNQEFNNLRPDALIHLSQSYTSHGFVIDLREAAALFHNVRESSESEKTLVQQLGERCRIPSQQLYFDNVTELYENILAEGEASDDNDE